MPGFIKRLINRALLRWSLADLETERQAAIEAHDAREIDSSELHSRLSDIETRRRALLQGRT